MESDDSIIGSVVSKFSRDPNETSEESTEDDVNLSRRSILRGTAGMAMLGGMSGISSAKPPERISEMNERTLSGTVAGELLSAGRLREDGITLSAEQQTIVGDRISDHAGELLEALDSKGLLEEADADIEDFHSGRAFADPTLDLEAAECGRLSFVPTPTGRTGTTEFEYRVELSTESGVIDEPTALNVVVLPEPDRSFAIVDPLSDSGPDQGEHRVIDLDEKDGPNDNQISRRIGTNDYISMGYTFTYCNGTISYQGAECALRKVECIGSNCREWTVGRCPGENCGHGTYDRKCATYKIDGCVVKRNPCPGAEDPDVDC